MKKIIYNKGLILINALIFGVIAIVVTVALTQWAANVLKGVRQLQAREQAFHIAEAGVDYYRWHLAHAQTDYYDGNGATSTGPYIHPFTDKDGNVVGQFALTITPPPIGSTVVKIKSVGTVNSAPGVSRTILSTLAIPSLAKFAVVADDTMRFGVGTEVFGPIHSNDGIHFDGIAHNVITSAKDKYNDPDFPGPPQFGVYTSVSPADPVPPAAVPTRSDVFMAGRQFPVTTFDFAGLTTNLSQMKSDAQSGGLYFGASGSQGYHVVFKTDDTFDLYKVTSLVSVSNNCTNNSNSGNNPNWSSWSIETQQFLQNYPNPANGIIFIEDHAWVDGQINTARITLATGKFPDNASKRKNIIVNTNLRYSNYTGSDVIALIAQGDFNVGLISDDVLRVDAAIIAQNGRVGRFYYDDKCGTSYVRQSMTLFGMLASSERYGFAYTDGTGYQNRNIMYDGNLLYSPPPSFPLTSSQYSTVSWDELK